MTRRMRLQFERLNLLAVLVILGAIVLAVVGKIPAQEALLLAAGIAVPGHTPTPPAE